MDLSHDLLGPLKPLVGVWEGDKGLDVAPDENRGTERNLFRERITFSALSPVQNHEQMLYGLRYSTVATRIGETDPFHEELGYWLWDPKEKQVIRCFMVPRGVTVIAGGTVEPTATSFRLSATCGSETYGICSNRFLDQQFKTVAYELEFTIHGTSHISYEEDTQLRIGGQKELFHHIDKNTLTKIS